MTPNEEIIQIIRLSPEPISAADIYEQCKSIETIGDVSSRLSQLFARGLIFRNDITTPGNRKGFVCTMKPSEAQVQPPEPADTASAPTAPLQGVRPVIETPTLATAAKPAKPAKPAKTGKGLDQVEATRQRVAHETTAESLADAILSNAREQISRQLALQEPLMSETAAAGIHITVHIEQVDFHLGGL